MKQKIYRYFVDNYKWVEKLLIGMLKIPSVSGKEQAVQDYIFKELSKIGAICKNIPASDKILSHTEYSDPVKNLTYEGRSNLWVEVPGKGKKTIVLNSHMDVVPPAPNQVDPYLPYYNSGGYLCARGACDAKGQIAAMALLIKAAVEMGPLENRIIGHIVIEEEIGGNGTLAILEACPGFHADALINMEPTNLRLHTSIRGAVWFDIQFAGTAGHAGSVTNTQSAIDKAIAAIELLKRYHAELYEKSKNYGLFKGVQSSMPLTIGEFHAGEWPSMVPGSARISGVIGILPNVTKWQVMEDIKRLFDREENHWIRDGMQIHFPYRHNGVELPTDHPLALSMMDAMAQCGLNTAPQAMTASTDAVYYHEMGIPSLAFGPGKLSDAHSAHECISINDVVKAAEVLYRYACKEC